MEEIKLKLTIDDTVVTTSISSLDKQVSALQASVKRLQSDFSSSFTTIVNELNKFDSATDSNVAKISEWINKQGLSQSAITQTITELQNQSRNLTANSQELTQNQTNLTNLTAAYQLHTQASTSLSGSTQSVTPGLQNMDQVISIFSSTLGDSKLLLTNFQSGITAIAQNLPNLISNWRSASSAAASAGTSMKSVLASSLMGPAGITLAINAAILAFNLLSDVWNASSKKAEEHAKKVKELSDEYKNLSLANQEAKQIELKEEYVNLLTKEMILRAQSVTILGITFEGDELEEVEKKREELAAALEAIQGTIAVSSANLGKIMDGTAELKSLDSIDSAITTVRQEYWTTDDEAKKETYAKKIEELKKLKEKKDILNKPQDTSASDSKKMRDEEFSAMSKEIQARQNHEKTMSGLQGDSDATRLQMKLNHLNEMLQLNEKYGKDTTQLTYSIQETEAEIENAKKPKFEDELGNLTKEQSHDEKMMGLDGADEETMIQTELDHLNERLEVYKQYGQDITDLQYTIEEKEKELSKAKEKPVMSNNDLKQMEINNIEDEYERKTKLADHEYELELEKYKNYKNFGEIKAQLDEEHRQTKEKLDKKQLEASLNQTASTLGDIAGLFGEQTVAYKAIKFVEITINTITAAMNAYASAAAVPLVGPVLAPIAAASAVAFGVKQQTDLMGVEIPGFAQGGSIVGENGIEIIQPAADYAQGFAVVASMTAMAVRDAYMRSFAGNGQSARPNKTRIEVSRRQAGLIFESGKDYYERNVLR